MKLDYPVSKSHAAFLHSVAKMYENWPGEVYMWTFTFKKYQSDERAMMRWKELSRKLQDEFPLLRGIRVVEVHPGGGIHNLSHGLHFHCLFNRRVSIHWLKRIASKYDFGRTSVRKVPEAEARYIGKYLTKAQPELAKGARRWGTIGWSGATKVRDIQPESNFHTNLQKIQKLTGANQLSPDIIHSCFVNTRLFGELKNWPVQKFYYSNRAQDFFESDDWRKHFGPREGTGTAEGGQKLLPRSNKRTREQSMLRIATMWKEMARRRSMTYDERVHEDWQKKQRKRGVEREAKPSEKIFYNLDPGSHPGNPGDEIQEIPDGQ